MAELKPCKCPFCGNEKPKVHITAQELFYVVCRNSDCEAYGPIRKDKQSAIDAWNKRS